MLEFIYERIPNSELQKIPGKGHAFNIEAPTETNELIWKFLKKYLI
jgi:pimeloyl-ACP methyl ester carboxylesterase